MTATQAKIGRNSPCPCGSGKKHKQCCLGKASPVEVRSRIGWSIAIVAVGWVGAGYLWSLKGSGAGLAAVAASVIVAAAIYVFRDPNPPRGGSGSDASAINFGG